MNYLLLSNCIGVGRFWRKCWQSCLSPTLSSPLLLSSPLRASPFLSLSLSLPLPLSSHFCFSFSFLFSLPLSLLAVLHLSLSLSPLPLSLFLSPLRVVDILKHIGAKIDLQFLRNPIKGIGQSNCIRIAADVLHSSACATVP